MFGVAAMINEWQDVIDSRDVIERIEFLETELAGDELRAEDREVFIEELASLKKLAVEGEGYVTDWKDGATLISGEYFTQYAREMAEDCYLTPMGPLANYIDWEKWADDVQTDYSIIDFNGVTFYAL